MIGNLEMVSELGKDYDFFKIAVLFFGLGSLMTCTHGLTIITKIKEMACYCESFRYSDRNALTNISNDLTHVSLPVEDG
jgi:hypothetical protein